MKYLLSFVLVLLFFEVVPAQPFNEQHSLFLEQFSYSFKVKDTVSIDSVFHSRWTTVSNFTFGKDRGDLTMIADLNALHPYFRDRISQLIHTCREQGIELAIVESFRTIAKQNEYKAMGSGYTRSTGGRSKHQYGLAIDVVPIIDSTAQWHDKILWKKVGIIGEALGLKWGGRWKHLYDPGHFEWTGGLTTTQLAQGIFPTVPNPEDYPCLQEDLRLLAIGWQSWELEQSAVASQKEIAVSTE